MAGKTPKLDKATTDLVKRMLAMPPKSHDEMKVGRPSQQKAKRSPKDRASSAKRRDA